MQWLLAGITIGVVLGADQLTKHLVRSSIPRGEERSFLPGVQLVDTRNRGVAFGFLPGSQTLVTILIGVALALLIVYFARNQGLKLIWLPTGMLIGGALGNIIDRARYGSVTDFVKLPLGWPPFNLADAAITLGILALFAVVETRRRGEENGGEGDTERGTRASGERRDVNAGAGPQPRP
jgi:signal peptidase II